MRSSILSATLALLLAAATGHLARAAEPEFVFGAATGEIEEPGSLTPVGHGRFATQDRVYAGRSVARSVVDDWATCFSGRFTSAEDWLLEAPRMTGTHQSTLTIRSERAVVRLRLRGQMEFPTASGRWEVQRATGACADLDGEGRYTVSFSSGEPEYQLTFEGHVGK